jgi:sterol desaturase/sphingolipid hydroxylase (fatty acid hydroxylase superfamily)
MQLFTEPFLKLFTLSVLRYLIIAGIPFVICYYILKGSLKRFKIQQRSAVRKDFIREVLHSLKTIGVLTGISYIVLYTPLRHFTRIYDSVDQYPLWWLFASVILSLVIHDTYFYWMHRLLHHPQLFRYIHLLHHRSTNPSPWASYSFHLIESFTEGAVVFVIVLVMPMYPTGIFMFVILAFIINVYGHLGYEIAPLWFRKTFLFEVFNTSVYHNLHHSKFKGNYGLYFRIWDRLMGTEHPDYVNNYDSVQKNRQNK